MSKNKFISNKKFGMFFSFLFFIIWVCVSFLDKSFNMNALFISSILLLLLSNFVPSVLKPFKSIWLGFGLILGNIFNPVLLFLIFYLIITPYAFLMRIFKYDSLKIKYRNDSNWTLIDKKIDENYFKNQF